MKKILIGLLVITLFTVLISCDDNGTVPEEIKDEPVTVTIISSPSFGENYVAFGMSQSEYEEYEAFAIIKYKAVKADDGFKTGETTEEKEFKFEENSEGGKLTLSLGYWNITLIAYNEDGKAVGTGTIEKVLVEEENQCETVEIKLEDEFLKDHCYTSFEDAVTAANKSNGVYVIMLLKDVEVNKTLDIEGCDLALELGGHTIKATDRVFNVKRGSLGIWDGVIDCTIATTVNDYAGKSVIKIESTLPKTESSEKTTTDDTTGSSDSDTTSEETEIDIFSDKFHKIMEKANASVYIDQSTTIYGRNCYGITAFGKDEATASIRVLGTIISANPCISGQGSTDFKTELYMLVGMDAVLTADTTPLTEAKAKTIDPVAIYQPNKGYLRIEGGTITSVDGSAVEIRAGKAEIIGGKFISKATEYSATAKGSGPTVKGAALAVSQHTVDPAKGIEVTVGGGVFVCEEKGNQIAIVDTIGGTSDASLKISTYLSSKITKIVAAENPTEKDNYKEYKPMKITTSNTGS